MASQGRNLELATEIYNTNTEDHKLVDLLDWDLPMHNRRLEESDFPEKVMMLEAAIKECSRLIIVSPEHNGGMPSVLVNMVSWLSRIPGGDYKAIFKNKPLSVRGISGGTGERVKLALESLFGYWGCIIHPEERS